MKTRSLKSFLQLICSAMVLAGCATTTKTAKDESFLASFPPNSLVIQNQTPYRLEVNSEGSTVVLTNVAPESVCVVSNFVVTGQEQVCLNFKATKFMILGCEVGDFPIGHCKRSFTISGSRLIVIEKKDF